MSAEEVRAVGAAPVANVSPGQLSGSRHLFDMGMLYASKTSAILVGVLILPQFNRLLGNEQFGVVALILSFQALLMVLDLGMSTLVGRELAASAPGDINSFRMLSNATAVISAAYLALTPVAFAARSMLALPISAPELLGILFLFWALTVQNIGQSALLARHRFKDAGLIQIVGVAARGLLTLAAMHVIGATLSVFVAAQLACAVLQLMATHLRCRHALRHSADTHSFGFPSVQECVDLALGGRSLMLFSLSGAAVMQLDKVLVSSFISPAAMSPYYLATMLCLTPITVLAGPISQFFQPRMIRAISIHDGGQVQRLITPFVTALVLVTLLPTALIWLMRDVIVSGWLGDAGQVRDVAHYTSILLPGIALGAFGYVPSVILVGRQDYRFQGRMSATFTVATLLGAAASGAAGSIDGVCWVYSTYHASSTMASWARCIYLERGEAHRFAISAAARAVVCTLMVVLSFLAVALGLRYF